MTETTSPVDRPDSRAADEAGTPAAAPRVLDIALQGGGAHGAYSWGVLDALLSLPEVEIGAISGTSAGAVNAVVLADGMVRGGREGARAGLRAFWRRVSELGSLLNPVRSTPFDALVSTSRNAMLSYTLFQAVLLNAAPRQFNPLDLNPLRVLLLEAVDFEGLRRQAPIGLRLCATNVRTGRPRIFSEREVTVEAVLASCCVPTLFRTVEIEGEPYWDGGFIGNPAIYPLIYGGSASDILLVHLTPMLRDDIPELAGDIRARMLELSLNACLVRELRAIAFVTRLIDEGYITDSKRADVRRIHMHALKSDAYMGGLGHASSFNTDWAFITKVYEEGRRAGLAWYADHGHDLGQRSTLDMADFT